MQLNWRKLCPLINAKRLVETHYPPRGATFAVPLVSFCKEKEHINDLPRYYLYLILCGYSFGRATGRPELGERRRRSCLRRTQWLPSFWRQLSVKNLVYKKEKNTSQITEIRQSTSQTSAAIVLLRTLRQNARSPYHYHWHSRRDNYNSTPQSFRRMGGGGKKSCQTLQVQCERITGKWPERSSNFDDWWGRSASCTVTQTRHRMRTLWINIFGG